MYNTSCLISIELLRVVTHILQLKKYNVLLYTYQVRPIAQHFPHSMDKTKSIHYDQHFTETSKYSKGINK